MRVFVDVENRGDREGTEIVQLYVNDVFSSVTTPMKELKGFAEVKLRAGQRETVQLTVPVPSLALVDKDGKHLVEPGEFEVMVGGSSADSTLLRAAFWVEDPSPKMGGYSDEH